MKLSSLPMIGLMMFGLQACIVPGSNIDASAPSLNSGTGFFNDDNAVWFPGLLEDRRDTTTEDAVTAMFSVVPITAQLLAEQHALSMPASTSSEVAPANSPVLMEEIANYDYFVDRGDLLTVTVYDHPELTNPSGSNNNNVESSGILIENDGTIYYPYIGKVQVAGKTVDQVRETIATDLAEFVTDPQVSVRVARFSAKRAYVTGQVGQPGPQPITNVPLTVLDAISRAGGLSENANWHEVLLSRNGEEYRLSVYEMLNNGRLGQNMLLQHGDVLHVPVVGQRMVYVLGELSRVNTLPLGNMSMSLTEALTRSGGLNQVTSNAEGIFVIRSSEATSDKLGTIYQLNVRNAVAFAVGAQFQLQPSDIVYVTTAPVTRWNRVISQILPSVNALFTADRLSGL